MTDERRTIGDLLREPATYGAEPGSGRGGAWRQRLLARHAPLLHRRGAQPGLTQLQRLLLLVALPVAVIVALGVAGFLGYVPGAGALAAASGWGESLAAAQAKSIDWLIAHPYHLWTLTIVLGIMPLVYLRDRLPELLHLDW